MLLKVHMLKSWPQKGHNINPNDISMFFSSTNPFKKDDKTQKNTFGGYYIICNQEISVLEDCWVHLVAHIDLHIMRTSVISI